MTRHVRGNDGNFGVRHRHQMQNRSLEQDRWMLLLLTQQQKSLSRLPPHRCYLYCRPITKARYLILLRSLKHRWSGKGLRRGSMLRQQCLNLHYW